jgi:hypothetical protein
MATMALFAFVGCGGDKGVDYGKPAVSVNPSSLSVSAAGETKTVQLTATVPWNIEIQDTKAVDKWLTVTPVTGEPSKEAQSITVTVAANTGEERSATITFKGDKLTTSLTVNQEAYYPDVTTASVSDFNAASAYKYQRYQLKGVVKGLTDNTAGIFNLVDQTGSVEVNGLTSKEVSYGTSTTDFASLGVNERDTVTIIGYQVKEDNKVQVRYAYLVKKAAYTEPDPDKVATVQFPFAADFTKGTDGFIVNNKIFPYVFDAIWTNSATGGMTANAYKDDSHKFAAESWLYSPMIDLSAAKDPVIVFDHIVNFFASIDVAKDQTSLWIRRQGGSWNQLAISFSYPDELGGSVMTSEDIKISDYIGSKVQIAFKYVSDETHDAGKWQILDVTVKENVEQNQSDNSDGTQDYDKPGWDWTK